jgi:hypothetical protein
MVNRTRWATKKEYFWEDAEAQRTQRNRVAVRITDLWQLSQLNERTIKSRPEQKVKKIYLDSDRSRDFLYCPRVGYSDGNLCQPAQRLTRGFHFIPSRSGSTRASRATAPMLSFSKMIAVSPDPRVEPEDDDATRQPHDRRILNLCVLCASASSQKYSCFVDGGFQPHPSSPNQRHETN